MFCTPLLGSKSNIFSGWKKNINIFSNLNLKFLLGNLNLKLKGSKLDFLPRLYR